MRITDVRVRKVAKEGKMKAVVSITLDDEFVVHDIKVIEVSGSSEDRTGGRVKRGRMPDTGKGFSYADVRNGRRNVSKNHGRAFLLFLYYICNSSEHQRNEKSDYANLFAIG